MTTKHYLVTAHDVQASADLSDLIVRNLNSGFNATAVEVNADALMAAAKYISNQPLIAMVTDHGFTAETLHWLFMYQNNV
jgi:hypothetical protein